MPNPLRTYQKCYILQEAEELQDLFLRHDIVCILEDDAPRFDPSFANSRFSQEYRIKLKSSDFSKADELLKKHYEDAAMHITVDYPLFSFTDLELFHLLEKPDEWSKFDFFVARKILEQRDLPVTNETIEEMTEKRIIDLAKPLRASTSMLFMAYLWVLFGGLIGVLQGQYLLLKKTLPNGREVVKFDLYSRNHGWIIIILGVLSFVIWSCIFYQYKHELGV